MRLTRLLYSVMATMLLSAAVCYSSVGSNSSSISIVDTTPKSWLDYINSLSTATLAIFTIVLAGSTIALSISTKRYTRATERLEKITKMNVIDNILRAIIVTDPIGGGMPYARYITHLVDACKNRELIPKDTKDDTKWVEDKVMYIHARLFTDLVFKASDNKSEKHNDQQ